MRALYVGPATRLGLARSIRLPRNGPVRIETLHERRDAAKGSEERDPLIDALLDALDWLDE